MMAIFNTALAVLIIALAAWTTFARGTFSAITAFLAYGALLALAWVQLGGVDVALTEAAIGGGLTGVLLLGAASRLRGGDSVVRLPLRVGAALLSAAVSIAIALCVLALPEVPPTLAPEVAANLARTELGNPITAVLLAFRAMDTLLEAIVLLFALIGVWSLSLDEHWGGRPGVRQYSDPNGILAYAARILPPIGIVVGAYIFWTGADEPGGKFQGATLLAAMWLLVLMAALADAPPISRAWLRIALVAGPLAFIAIGFFGLQATGHFLAYPEGFAKPLIIAIELALLPSLTLVLGLLLLGAPRRGAQP
jgi:multisubunit Na+/H+ antiporter MnhB subunit